MEDKVGGVKRYTRSHLDGEQRYAKRRRTEQEEKKSFVERMSRTKEMPKSIPAQSEGWACTLGPSVAKSIPDGPRKFNKIMEMFKKLDKKMEDRKPPQETRKNEKIEDGTKTSTKVLRNYNLESKISLKTPEKLPKQNLSSPRSKKLESVSRNYLNEKKKQKTPLKVQKGKKLQTSKGGKQVKSEKKNENCKKIADIRNFFEPKNPEAPTANIENRRGDYVKNQSTRHSLKSLMGDPQQTGGTDVHTATPSNLERSYTDNEPSLAGGGIKNRADTPDRPPTRDSS